MPITIMPCSLLGPPTGCFSSPAKKRMPSIWLLLKNELLLGTVLSSQISLSNDRPQSEQRCPYLLRRVVVWDEQNQQKIVLLTNHLNFEASTITAIYNDHWKIEIFFKTLKQHLKVKTFIGASENALRIRIWTALVALLLLKYLHHLSRFGWLSNLSTMLRLNLYLSGSDDLVTRSFRPTVLATSNPAQATRFWTADC